MKPYVWFEFKGLGRFVIMGASVAVIILFWRWLIPGEFERILFKQSYGRNGASGLFISHAAWFGGWIILLFARVQDLDITLNYDFEIVRKLIACALLILGSVFMVFVFAAHALRH